MTVFNVFNVEEEVVADHIGTYYSLELALERSATFPVSITKPEKNSFFVTTDEGTTFAIVRTEVVMN